MTQFLHKHVHVLHIADFHFGLNLKQKKKLLINFQNCQNLDKCLKISSTLFHFTAYDRIVCVEIISAMSVCLSFYGLVNTVKVMSRQSFNLHTFSGQA